MSDPPKQLSVQQGIEGGNQPKINQPMQRTDTSLNVTPTTLRASSSAPAGWDLSINHTLQHRIMGANSFNQSAITPNGSVTGSERRSVGSMNASTAHALPQHGSAGSLGIELWKLDIEHESNQIAAAKSNQTELENQLDILRVTRLGISSDIMHYEESIRMENEALKSAADEREAVRDHLERVLEAKELELHELSVIKEQNNILMSNVQEIRKQVQIALEDSRKLRTIQSELSDELSKSMSDITKYKETNEKMSASYAARKNELDTNISQYNKMCSELEAAETDVERLKEDISQVQRLLDKKSEEYKQLKLEFEEKRHNVKQLDMEVQILLEDLNQLERDYPAKMDEYSSIQATYANLEQNLRLLHGQRTEVEDLILQLEEKSVITQKEVNEYQAFMKSIRDDYVQKKRILSELEQEKIKMQIDTTKLTESLRVKQEELRALVDDRTRTQRELDSLSADHSRLEAELHDESRRKKALMDLIAHLESQQHQWKISREQLVKTQESVDEGRKNLQKTREGILHLEADLAHITSSLDDLCSEKKGIEEEADRISKTHERTSSEFTKLREEISLKKEEIREWTAQLDELRQSKENLKKRYEVVVTNSAKVKSKITKLQLSIQETEQLNIAYEAKVQDLNKIHESIQLQSLQLVDIIQSVHAEISQSEFENQRLEHHRKELMQLHKDQKEATRISKQDISALEGQIDGLLKTIESQELGIERLKEDISQKRKQSEQLEQEANQLQEQYSAFDTVCKNLVEKKKTLNEHISHQRSAIDSEENELMQLQKIARNLEEGNHDIRESILKAKVHVSDLQRIRDTELRHLEAVKTQKSFLKENLRTLQNDSALLQSKIQSATSSFGRDGTPPLDLDYGYAWKSQ